MRRSFNVIEADNGGFILTHDGFELPDPNTPFSGRQEVFASRAALMEGIERLLSLPPISAEQFQLHEQKARMANEAMPRQAMAGVGLSAARGY